MAGNPISIPAEFINRVTGNYDPTLVPKDERCRIIDCPEIHWAETPIESGSFVTVEGIGGPHRVVAIDGPMAEISYGDMTITIPIAQCTKTRHPGCKTCTGPVQWKGHAGHYVGVRRSCTACAMNGMCLSVCFAGCHGPNTEFACDGQDMVTLGAFDDASGFIEDNLPDNRETQGGYPDIDQEDDDQEPEWSRFEKHVASRIIDVDGSRFEALVAAVSENDSSTAARIVGIARSAFAGPDSIGVRIITAMKGMHGSDWDVVREQLRHHVTCGNNQSDVARLTGVTKQAVNVRMKGIIRKTPWVRRLER